MNYFFGPFIGEFGFELVYWHGWLRYIKENYFKKNDKMIVSSFPGRYPLYEFADEFIPLPEWYIKNNFSERGYFIDWEDYDLKKQTEIKNEMSKLIQYFKDHLKDKEVMFVNEYPQKIYTQKLYYRIKRQFNKKILDKFKGEKKIDSVKSYLENCNTFAGKYVKKPLFVNYPSLRTGDYLGQEPRFEHQKYIKLKPTNIGEIRKKEILEENNYDGKKPIFTIFPRKRIIRRPDKNWTEDNWMNFISNLIKKFDPLIILCGTKNGSFLTNYKNDSNVINIINESPNSLMDLQLAFIKMCEVSIQGKSGSVNLALQANCPSFLMGEEKERYYVCKRENPFSTSIYFYTEYELNPPHEKFFEKFCEYYETIKKI
jgi:ADP-heptose:LPS heptosyltransferase